MDLDWFLPVEQASADLQELQAKVCEGEGFL